MKLLNAMVRMLPLLISLSVLCSCGTKVGTGSSGLRLADSPTGLTAWRDTAGENQAVCDYRSRIVFTPHIRFDAGKSFTTRISFLEQKPELDKPYAMSEYVGKAGAIRFLDRYSGSETARQLVVTLRQADDTEGSAVVMDYVLETVSGLHSEGTLETTLDYTDYLGCASAL